MNDPEEAKRIAAEKRKRNNEATRRWRISNPEKAQASSKAAYRKRYDANPEHFRELSRAYRAANPEKARERVRPAKAAWTAKHPDEVRAYQRNRRARLRAAEGRHTAADIEMIHKAQRRRCAHCRVSIKAGWHVDHIIPLSRGGSNWPRNLQLLCAPCNLKKHARDPITFAQIEGRLI